jgi:hypothetical protein
MSDLNEEGVCPLGFGRRRRGQESMPLEGLGREGLIGGLPAEVIAELTGEPLGPEFFRPKSERQGVDPLTYTYWTGLYKVLEDANAVGAGVLRFVDREFHGDYSSRSAGGYCATRRPTPMISAQTTTTAPSRF